MLTREELDRVRVVLVRTRNPLNMGAVARAMSNFGFLRLRVVAPYEAAFRQARSAVGALQVLAEAEECASVADAVADCALVVGTTAVGKRELLHPLHRLEAGGRLVRERLASSEQAKVTLLFGSEKTGLSKEELSYCDFLLRIPTRGEHRSMNLGQAAAVCLYELVRDAERPAPAQGADAGARAQSAELARLEAVLLHVLAVTEYTEAEARVATEQRVRRLLRRMQLRSEDVETWLGMLRKVVWKLERGK